jgi:Uma2 family endonuclease
MEECSGSKASGGRSNCTVRSVGPQLTASTAETQRRGGKLIRDRRYNSAVATQTLVSFDEFLALPEEEARRYEYVDGELVEVATGTINHNFIRDWLAHKLLSWWAETRNGWIGTEVLFRLPNGRGYRPDLMWLKHQPADVLCVEGCPDLAVEVVSASDIAQDVERKVSDYLSCGASEVWVVWPRDRQITIRTGASTIKLGIGDTLTSNLVPGFSLPVADLFIL